MRNKFFEKFREPYIIAEVNSSHNGDIRAAKEMIDAAAKAGCNCVKFQSWTADTLYSIDYYKANPILKRFVTKLSLTEELLYECAKHCEAAGVTFCSTPYSNREVDFLVEDCGVSFVKIASMDINNFPFLEYIADKGVPIILSTGMADIEEIQKAVEIITAKTDTLCLLHCVSQYPTKVADVNLNNLKLLNEKFPNILIGFSDHTLGIAIAPAAVAMGAVIIEKHLTLDRTKIGMDNQMAIEPNEMAELVKCCKNVHTALGQYERVVSREEMLQREKMRRSLVYARDLPVGTILTAEDFEAKRPGTGFAPTEYTQFIGKSLTVEVSQNELVKPNHYSKNDKS